MNEPKKRYQTRGFASMDPARRREIASMGGTTAHRNGRAHQFTSSEAAEAGRKSWLKRHEKKTGAA